MFQHPVEVDQEFLEELKVEAHDWAIAHGLMVHKKTEEGQPPDIFMSLFYLNKKHIVYTI